MGAKTRLYIVGVLLGKIALAGVALASPLSPTAHHDSAGLDEPAANLETVALMRQDGVVTRAPSPIPLPTSLALIGSSLLVLALVGATL